MKKSIYLCIIVLLSTSSLSAKTIRYVKSDGTGDGSSWVNASSNIQAMLDNAVSGDEVWVAKGTYYPTNETIARDPRSKSFVTKSGVVFYGGFAGTETNISQRALSDIDLNGKVEPWEFTNATILSGDIDGVADVWTKTTNADGFSWKWTITGNSGNCYRVVTANSVIDGFAVVGGNANITYIDNGGTNFIINGGGIYSYNSSVSVINCSVSNCSASNEGGGIYSYSSSVTNCIVNNCTAGGTGGGLYSNSATNCTVSNCSANYGGGLYSTSATNCTVSNCSAISAGGIYSLVSVDNCKVSNCSAIKDGGGIYSSKTSYSSLPSLVDKCMVNNCTAGNNGGGIFSTTYSFITNCTVSNCSANSYGGGIYSSSTNSSPVANCTVCNCSANRGGGIYSVSATNCTVSNCIASSSGGGIYSFSSDYIANCAVSNNKNGNTISNIEGISQLNCISPDITTVYIKPTSFVGNAITDAQKVELLTADWHLKEGSPCINAGTSSYNYLRSSILSGKDLGDNSRVNLGNIDIGAYEYQIQTLTMPAKEDFNYLSDWNSSNVFYNSTKLNGGQDLKWNITNQKAQFSWQTNLTNYYSQPFFTYQIDATNAAKVYLRYDMYYQAYAGTISPLGTEKLNIEYSNDFITWSNIATYTNANGTIANQTYKHDLSNQLAGKKFYIRFNANGDNSNRIEKWEIDNVIIDADGVSAVNTAHDNKYKYSAYSNGIIVNNLEIGASVQLFDIKGKLLNTISAESQNAQLTLLIRGVYLVKVTSDSGVENKKVVW